MRKCPDCDKRMKREGVTSDGSAVVYSCPCGKVVATEVSVSKYRAVPKEVDGIRFHSTKEADRYEFLRNRAAEGEIACLELQPVFLLKIDGKTLRSPSGRVLEYRADFRYIENSRYVIEDVKGKRTREYWLKKQIVEIEYGITIQEV